MAARRSGITHADTDGTGSFGEKSMADRSSTDGGINGSPELKKEGFVIEEPVPRYESEESLAIHADTVEDITTQVITVEDDPTINPWTFRMFFLGTLFFYPCAIGLAHLT